MKGAGQFLPVRVLPAILIEGHRGGRGGVVGVGTALDRDFHSVVEQPEYVFLNPQRELGEAGTLGELEELTCQIGDMVTRELTQREVTRRADALDVEEALCPDCGKRKANQYMAPSTRTAVRHPNNTLQLRCVEYRGSNSNWTK